LSCMSEGFRSKFLSSIQTRISELTINQESSLIHIPYPI
jgi:hypothetical protein